MNPFRINIPEVDLDDLRRRLDCTRWPPELPQVDWDRGVPVAYLSNLVEYWRSVYDRRAAEAKFNQFPQFTTEVDGANVHFLHVRSPEANAVPLLLTHGWPGSVAEFLHVIGPLSDPASHGGDPNDAFHLVIPSVPGFGFSGPVSEKGWDIVRVARAWAELMRRLGYEQYLVQGGDLGAFVSLVLAGVDHEHVGGAHVNFLVTPPSEDPAELESYSEADQGRLAQMAEFISERSGYMRIRPPAPRHWRTHSPTRPSGRSLGSWRSSGSGPIQTKSPKTPSTATSSSRTPRSTG
jgi:epoxide hydrolase